MSKILCGILNWKRTSKQMKKGLDKLPGDIVVCTDNPEFWENKRVKTIEAVPSVAASKNKILQAAIDGEYDFVFIIEDDVIASRKEDLINYINIMNCYDLSVMMYGFGSAANKVLNNKPNPCIICNDGRGHELYINRYPCSTVMVFKVKKGMKFFDENLHCLETDYLLYEMAEQGQYPFKGFFFDIPESWNAWRPIKDLTRVREKPRELINKDRQLRGNLTLDNNVDKVINYIKTHRG